MDLQFVRAEASAAAAARGRGLVCGLTESFALVGHTARKWPHPRIVRWLGSCCVPPVPMIERAIRKLARRCGLNLPFRGVVCAEQVRTIYIEPDWHARITVKKTLVFLEQPGERDLYDTYSVGHGERLEQLAYDSPDAMQVAREDRKDGSVVIYWQPRVDIIPYALYMHQDTWVPPTAYKQAAIFAEYRSDGRTGVAVTEIVTPMTFEAAVVFERPRWPRLTSERALVQYAMDRLDGSGDRPVITSDGKRLEWRIEGPKPGVPYVCVVFHQHGVAEWQERFKTATLLGRLTALVTRARRLLPV
jgi:hypothetical protein